MALLNYYQDNFNQDEGQPVAHSSETIATLLKVDWVLNPSNTLSVSYNFNHSRNENATFDVATYGTSANGIEGDPTRINVLNLNLFSTLSPTKLNEFHATYSRESRPRRAATSNVGADTGMGFGPTFRFGSPFFLQPNVDELFWRSQLKNNFTLVAGTHTIKVGGDWIHSVNDQVFRGFFTTRFLFDSVPGFLRYASPAAPGGFGPNTVGCSDGSYVTHPATCRDGSSPTNGPLLFYLNNAGTGKPGVPPPGAANTVNDEFGVFAQDTWAVTPNLTLSYGLRWDAQTMGDTLDPSRTIYSEFIGEPGFPSDGTIPDQWDMWQPRVAIAWDVSGDAKTLIRSSFGIYNPRQNMLTQVSAQTDNGAQQQGFFASTENLLAFGAPTVPYPETVDFPAQGPDDFAFFVDVHVFDKDYKDPRIYTFNAAVEREIVQDWAAYVDFTYSKGTRLTRFINYNREEPAVCCDQGPGTGNTYTYGGAPFSPRLNTIWVHNSLGESKYRAVTVGLRKRFSNGFQFDANYVYSKDEDHDSNERDPFTERVLTSSTSSRTGVCRIATSSTGSTSTPTSSSGRSTRTFGGSIARRSRSRSCLGCSTGWIGAATASGRTTSSSPSTGAWPGPSASGRRGGTGWSPSWRCSTPSTAPTTSTRCRARRCSTSTASCAPAWATLARCRLAVRFEF